MTRFIDYLEENTLPTDDIEEAHAWLLAHLSRDANLLPLRATGSFGLAGTQLAAREHRARRIPLARSGRVAVFCDNELPVWLYGSMPENGFFLRSFQALLDGRIAPVADGRARREGDGTLVCETVLRMWGASKRHKHVFDAGLPRGADNSALTRDEVVSKFLRLVHPANFFLYPADLSLDAEQNSAPEYQYVAAVFMSRRCPEVFRDFLERIRPESFGWNPRWRETGEALADKLLLPPPVVTTPRATVADVSPALPSRPTNDRSRPDTATLVAFDVVENGQERFHLEGFGISTGGANRDRPFFVRVLDRNGRILLESHPTTAESLRIAVRGRRDYDQNRFHQSDLVVRASPTDRPRPFSPIGRRIPWRCPTGSSAPETRLPCNAVEPEKIASELRFVPGSRPATYAEPNRAAPRWVRRERCLLRCWETARNVRPGDTAKEGPYQRRVAGAMAPNPSSTVKGRL